MSILNAHDVVRFAIRIEEDGELFYREAAGLADNKEARALFARLADEEVGHRNIFQGISETLGGYAPAETYDGEYMAYLRDHIDGKAVFRGDLKGSLKATLASAISAIDFAIGREMDSILYYQEVRAFVPERQKEVVDRIIEEERKHFIMLSNARKGYL
ncbi:MAG: ferritin family protein [Syntrophorhabdales bacterium]|jgi:rubrerythrin